MRNWSKTCSTSWFLDMDLMERSFDTTVFTKNRQRLMDHDVGRAQFDEVVWAADGEVLLLDVHFSVDGTLIEAAARLKSFRPKDGSPPPPTDDGTMIRAIRRWISGGSAGATRRIPAPLIPRRTCCARGRGKEVKLAFLGYALMENRHGLLMDFTVSLATSTGLPAVHAGGRPRLRHPGLCAGHPRATGDAARDPEEALGHRRSHDASCRLWGEPVHPQAGRGDLRLDEDGGRVAAHPSRKLGPC